MSFGRGSAVRVEPFKSPNAPGGVKWKVVVGGSPSSQHNYKDTAVKKGRQKARGNNTTLKVFNKNMNISEQRDYS